MRPAVISRSLSDRGRRAQSLALIALVVAAFVVYANSLESPFFFDDGASITENPTIRQLIDLGRVLHPPPGGLGVSGRPVLNLSLAIDYAFTGPQVLSYHLTNLLIHAGSALLLFGIVRRTLVSPPNWTGGPERAIGAAFLVAALWALHPLQTESVTCVIQRTESLFSLFYLLTLYGFLRAREPGWAVAAVAACALGMASKEVMVSAPLIVLAYDRAFVAGSFRAAWRSSRRLYLGLASTWLILGWLVIRSGGSRGQAAGFSLGVSAGSYALKQCAAITHYLFLALWPHPLVVDYGTSVVTSVAAVAPQALFLLGLVGATVFACARWPRLGFLGLWFFAILAPSSSILPLVSQTMAEHRMYLPLAALAAGVVWAGLSLWSRYGWAAALGSLGAFGLVAAARNQDFRTPIAIWHDTAVKVPDNPRAHINLSDALRLGGHLAEANREAKIALDLEPNRPEALNNLGAILLDQGQPQEAISKLEAALTRRPDFALAENNLGSALAQAGRGREARQQLEKALRDRPEFPEAESNLAGVLLEAGEVDQALVHCASALREKPDLPMVHFNLGDAARRQGHLPEAVAHLERAVELWPGYFDAQRLLGTLLYQLGRPAEGIPHLEAALRRRPNDSETLNNLGSALLQGGRLPEATEFYRRAIRARPDYAEAHCNLALALVRAGQVGPASAEFEEALRINPNYTLARNNLAYLRSHPGGPPPRE